MSIRILALALSTLMIPFAADARPPDVTWDWYNAGNAYLNYPKPDGRLSARYFRKAAEQGNDAAQYKLGEFYENGTGVRRDYGEALRWYRMAAETGNKYAEYKVGEFLQNGKGTRKNPAEAADWYMRAARQGNPWAYHMLGFMLADGEGVRKDPALAERYLEISVRETGDDWGKWKLGQLIRNSDPGRSQRLFAEAAAQGNTEARRELAVRR